jgi:hypothetical protein
VPTVDSTGFPARSCRYGVHPPGISAVALSRRDVEESFELSDLVGRLLNRHRLAHRYLPRIRHHAGTTVMLPDDMDRCPHPADARLAGCPCDAGRPKRALPRSSPFSEWVPSRCSQIAVGLNDDRLRGTRDTRARVRLQKGLLRCARPGRNLPSIRRGRSRRRMCPPGTTSRADWRADGWR